MANLMTRATYERMHREMAQIEEVEVPKMSKAKQAAAEEGDLKENAEYHACKEKLEMLNNRYAHIRERLAGVSFIDDLKIPGTVVSIGTTVELKFYDTDETRSYTILGSEDADIEKNIISNLSPLAKGMIGKKPGMECDIRIPEGIKKVKVLSIKVFNT